MDVFENFLFPKIDFKRDIIRAKIWFPWGKRQEPIKFDGSYKRQEPIKWSLHLPYMPLESTLSRVDL